MNKNTTNLNSNVKGKHNTYSMILIQIFCFISALLFVLGFTNMKQTHAILTLVLITALFDYTSASRLEIFDYNTNSGILALETGTVFIKEGFHTLVQRFNLYAFRVILKQYE